MRKAIKIAMMFFSMSVVAALSSCDPKVEAPAAPTALKTGDITEVSAVLSWSGDATDYEVIVGDAAAKPVTGKSYSATGLTADTDYKWKVRAIAGDLASDWVEGPDFKTAKTEIPSPDAPTALNVTDITETSATFTWEGSSAAYEINVGEIIEIVSVKTFTTTELTAETSYRWKVRAIEGDLTSEWVEGESFTTLAIPEPPAAPTGLEVSNVGRTSAKLKWEGTTASYELELYDSLFSSADTTLVEAKTIDLTTLRAGTIYEWRIRAVEGGLFSAWTAGTTFTTGMSSLTGDVDIPNMVQGVAQYYGDTGTNGASAFSVSLGTETAEESTFQVLMLEMYTTPGDGLSIPAGTYPINSSREAGTANKGQLAGGVIPIGCVYIDIVSAAAVSMAPLQTGQVIVTSNGSTYRLETEGVDDIGYSVTGVYEGEMEFQDKRPESAAPAKANIKTSTFLTLSAQARL